MSEFYLSSINSIACSDVVSLCCCTVWVQIPMMHCQFNLLFYLSTIFTRFFRIHPSDDSVLNRQTTHLCAGWSYWNIPWLVWLLDSPFCSAIHCEKCEMLIRKNNWSCMCLAMLRWWHLQFVPEQVCLLVFSVLSPVSAKQRQNASCPLLACFVSQSVGVTYWRGRHSSEDW